MTVCTQNKECLFGSIMNGQMLLNPCGEIVQEEWLRTATLRSNVELDEFVVMPNHFHGIIFIVDGRGTARRAPTFVDIAPVRERFGKPVRGSVPTILRSFKAAVTKRINESRSAPWTSVWQRNYYEHVIRNENELFEIRQYIQNNPMKWDLDPENLLAKR